MGVDFHEKRRKKQEKCKEAAARQLISIFRERERQANINIIIKYTLTFDNH